MTKTKVIVGISDAKISNNKNEVVTTHSLGSCIGLCMYDAGTYIGAMLHYQLPDSKACQGRANENPFMFADLGTSLMFDKMISMGASKNRIKVVIAGGAAMLAGPKGFDIGKRNILAIRKILWKKGMLISAHDVGGSSPRNMLMDIGTGEISIDVNCCNKILHCC